jgi:hypothetical protein
MSDVLLTGIRPGDIQLPPTHLVDVSAAMALLVDAG